MSFRSKGPPSSLTNGRLIQKDISLTFTAFKSVLKKLQTRGKIPAALNTLN